MAKFNWKRWDSAAIGGFAGLLAAKPEYAITVNSWFARYIPESWDLGIGLDWTIVVVFVLIGLLVGYLADRS